MPLQDKQITDLYTQIQFEALKETHKNQPLDLTLMEMLNAYDQVVNYQSIGSQYAPHSGLTSPGNDI